MTVFEELLKQQKLLQEVEPEKPYSESTETFKVLRKTKLAALEEMKNYALYLCSLSDQKKQELMENALFMRRPLFIESFSKEFNMTKDAVRAALNRYQRHFNVVIGGMHTIQSIGQAQNTEEVEELMDEFRERNKITPLLYGFLQAMYTYCTTFSDTPQQYSSYFDYLYHYDVLGYRDSKIQRAKGMLLSMILFGAHPAFSTIQQAFEIYQSNMEDFDLFENYLNAIKEVLDQAAVTKGAVNFGKNHLSAFE